MPTDNDTLLTKAEAAKELHLSERAVARHAEAGRLTPIYQPKSDGGSRVFYGAADVKRLRSDLAQPRERKATALARIDTRLPAVVQASDRPDVKRKAGELPLSELAHRVALTIPEAAALSGFGVGAIERAIDDGALTAIQAGPKGSRIVGRAAVEAWALGHFDNTASKRRGR
jgi:hypothetical protein